MFASLTWRINLARKGAETQRIGGIISWCSRRSLEDRLERGLGGGHGLSRICFGGLGGG